MKTPKNGTIVACWVGLVVVGTLAGIAPGMRSLQRIEEESGALQGRIARADDGAAELRRLAEQLAELSKRAADEATPIPRDGDVAGLIRQLSEQLDQLEVHDREITTGGPSAADGVSLMPMSVTAQGRFLSVYEAVRWVEGLPRLVRVQRLRIDTERIKNLQPGHVRTELLLDIFFAPESAASTVAGAEGGKQGGGS